MELGGLSPNVLEVFKKSLTLFSIHLSLVLLMLLTLFLEVKSQKFARAASGGVFSRALVTGRA